MNYKRQPPQGDILQPPTGKLINWFLSLSFVHVGYPEALYGWVKDTTNGFSTPSMFWCYDYYCEETFPGFASPEVPF